MKSFGTPLGLVLVLLGLIWTAQGIGWLEGSPMTDETLWAVLGPITAAIGAVLALRGLRGRASGDEDGGR